MMISAKISQIVMLVVGDLRAMVSLILYSQSMLISTQLNTVIICRITEILLTPRWNFALEKLKEEKIRVTAIQAALSFV